MDADVVIFGAGAAGLAAARRLAEQSLSVIVVEARDRPGGRSWSRRTSRAAVPAEIGAEFIHGRAPETMALLRETGSAAIETGGETWKRTNGDLRPDEDDGFDDTARIFATASTVSDDLSVNAFLRRFEGDESLREAVRAARSLAEGFDAADPDLASARSIGEEWQSGVDSLSARPLGGYRPIIEHLHAACARAGVSVRLASPVRRVAWRPGSVEVTVDGGEANVRTLHARAAIVTLPVGVLQHTGDEHQVVFDPPLPMRKREALEHVVMGAVVRVALEFRSAFWEDVRDGRYRDAAFFRCEDDAFGVYWTQMPVRSELVTAWAGGPKARTLAACSEPELVERAVDGFGTLFGERARARREFLGAYTHDWVRDPYAFGAYSYVAVGGGDARERLAAAVGDTLFFAGEATAGEGQGGTVNGALETGERAAREAAAALGVALSR